jgi:hypothetical protein
MRSLASLLLGFAFWQLASCGPGLSTTRAPYGPIPPPVRAGAAPPADADGFRRLLAGDVINGGMWFPDADCEARFGHAATIRSEHFDAFARCVGTLHLRPTGRAHWHDDTSVLTDDAGFEIEAHVVDGHLDFIGFSARASGMPDLPSITPEALEALRISGDSKATISEEEAEKVIVPGSPTPHVEHLRLCLGETGELTTVMPGQTMTPASAAAFSAIARGWKFRSFVVGGKPMSVCAIVAFAYPATGGAAERRLPRPPELSKAGHLVYNVRPVDLEALRVRGSKMIVPDDEDKIHLNGKRLIGSFKLCLDETGHYERGTLIKSTEVPRYDAKIARALMGWAYRPYVVDGRAIPVCSAVTFIYTQR